MYLTGKHLPRRTVLKGLGVTIALDGEKVVVTAA